MCVLDCFIWSQTRGVLQTCQDEALGRPVMEYLPLCLRGSSSTSVEVSLNN